MPYLGKNFDPSYSQTSPTRGWPHAHHGRGGYSTRGRDPKEQAYSESGSRYPGHQQYSSDRGQYFHGYGRNENIGLGNGTFNGRDLDVGRFYERNGHDSRPEVQGHRYTPQDPNIPSGPRADRPLATSHTGERVNGQLVRETQPPTIVSSLNGLSRANLNAIPGLTIAPPAELPNPPTSTPSSAENLDSLAALRKFKEEVAATRKLRQSQDGDLDPGALARMAESFLKTQSGPSAAVTEGSDRHVTPDTREMELKERLKSRERSRGTNGSLDESGGKKAVKLETVSYEEGQIIETPTSSSIQTPRTPLKAATPIPVGPRYPQHPRAPERDHLAHRRDSIPEQQPALRANFVPARFLKPGKDRAGNLITIPPRGRSPERSRSVTPVYEWRRAEHARLIHPVEDYDQNGKTRLDYRYAERAVDSTYANRSSTYEHPPPPSYPTRAPPFDRRERPPAPKQRGATPDRDPRRDYPRTRAPSPVRQQESVMIGQETIVETLAALKAQIANLEKLAKSGAMTVIAPPLAAIPVRSSDSRLSDSRNGYHHQADTRYQDHQDSISYREPIPDEYREYNRPQDLPEYTFPSKSRYPEAPSPRERIAIATRDYETSYRVPSGDHDRRERSPPLGPRINGYDRISQGYERESRPDHRERGRGRGGGGGRGRGSGHGGERGRGGRGRPH